MGRFIVSSLLLLATVLPACAQYVESWQVQQNYYEYGVLPYDYNGDGATDLTKLLGNNVTVYDGTNEFSELWSVTADGWDFLTLWDRVELEDESELYLFLASDELTEFNFRVRAYAPLQELPEWTSSIQPGSIANLVAGNLDDDSGLELAFGRNVYIENEENYDSRFFVLDAATGNVEYDSGTLDGYLAGPYTGDMNGDGRDDILVNLYDLVNETATLHAFEFQGAGVEGPAGDLLPRELELGANYPNPFNSGTRIPVRLERPADVEINVVNTLGQRVKQLVSGRLGAQLHVFHWDGTDDQRRRVSSGLYFYEIITDGHRLERPMVLLR